MKLTLPIRLSVSLNSRGISRVAAIIKAKAIQAERAAVMTAFSCYSAKSQLSQLRNSNPSELWTVTLTRVAPRELDDDNLHGRLKAVRDQVAAELGINDRDKRRLLFIPEQRKGEPKQHAVEILIETRVAWAAAEMCRVARLNQEANLAHQKALNDAMGVKP